MLYRTKGNADPNGRPKVYFTCHPNDFDRYFDKLCEDIFKSHDCAIYYTPDITEAFEEDRETVLGRMNLFIVPITFNLLSQPCRATEDIAFAQKSYIPILPFMMESGLDLLYAQSRFFGERQYLSPFSHDLTEVSYELKLKKYLDTVLVSDELVACIRKAFDAYVFLSYRKKDRRYANELMRLIHENPDYRDIAIWFDEFLTPGESFRENIEKNLKNSKLFTLLVTPRILETVDGKPNFVVREEYPAALQASLPVLPTEMEETDKKALKEAFEGLPPCADPKDPEAFYARLAEAISKLALRPSDRSPLHNFLIGVAYLDGIDVEVNKERGMALIVSAAEDGEPQAMKMLYELYSRGKGTAVDFRKSCYYAEKLYGHLKALHGENHPDTLEALNNLAVSYTRLGEYQQALALNEKAYAFSCAVFGEEHHGTLTVLNNLASCYFALGLLEKARELTEKAYVLGCKALGEKHRRSMVFLSNLALITANLGESEKAVLLYEKVYALCCGLLGEEHPDTLMTLNNLAYAHAQLGDEKKGLALYEKAYTLSCRVQGEEHPDTLIFLGNLALAYSEGGELIKALSAAETVYRLRLDRLGATHPYTVNALTALASVLCELGEFEKAKNYLELLHSVHERLHGEAHPETLEALNLLAVCHSKLGDQEKALVLKTRSYELHCKAFGEEHPNTLAALNNLAFTYGKLNDYERAIELQEKLCFFYRRLLSEDDPVLVKALARLEEFRQKPGVK